MRIASAIFLVSWACAGAAVGPDDTARSARERWLGSPHGQMLERLIPPYLLPSGLPDAGLEGARLTGKYCVQCHHLANPAMHHAEKWPATVQRMLLRMEGRGNMGHLMRDLMADLQSPTPAEAQALTRYLQKHAQTRVNADLLPEAGQSRAWSSFTVACAQCHTLPDPRRHTRAEWPAVVARMEKNMAWMNRMVGSKSDPREPQYRSDDIIAYLQRHARR